ncbi:MAG: cupin domain-containing protein [Desulfurivibrio sp.]|nr:MAG: cupin domain-containing protein [Desulfurivibrio sp.]
MMRAQLKKGSSVKECMTDERCFIAEIANDADDEQVSIARARVRPGIATAWHRVRGTCERYLIVAGQGRAEVEGLEPLEVSAGDVVRIPARCAQRIINTGDSDLIFYCVCSPRFRQENYESLE